MTPALHAKLLWAEWRHHPWRQAAAVLAVALGVALAFAVQLINASALAEFDTAVHAASGAPDFSIRPRAGTLPEDVYARIAQAPGVERASPAIDVAVGLRGSDGRVHPAHVLGLDALIAPYISPGWLTQVDTRKDSPASAQASTSARQPSDGGLSALDPELVFVNPAARALLGGADHVELQVAGHWQTLAIGGRIAADGPALMVMDIAGAQTHFDRLGSLSRVDVRLAPGASREAVMAALGAHEANGGGSDLRAAAPDEAALRMARLSQSYRVNLSVLSLVALFTGGFLVFSVQSLAVAKRIPQLALLGVLGMSGARRRGLIWIDSLLVGLIGGVFGLALGTGLAQAALTALGGDLGSGALTSSTPRLQWSVLAALAYGGLGMASAFAGGWWPARAARTLAPAQSLKGLSADAGTSLPTAASVALIAVAVALAFVPPWGAVPWGAYACVALLLLGGIGLVPQTVALLLRGLRGARHPVGKLAVARAIDQRHTATAAVAGVVASLSLVVALTVMVTSFRDSLSVWLNDVLPADLYVRPAQTTDEEPAFLAPPVTDGAPRLAGVRQVREELLTPVLLAADQPEAVLIARDVLPIGSVPPVPWIAAPDVQADDRAHGLVPVYASEVLAALQHWKTGDTFALPLPAGAPAGGTAQAVVRGIWRDYARQQGALLIARGDWLRLSGDARVSDLVVWLGDGASAGAVTDALKRLAPAGSAVQVSTSGQIRALSLRIFDRSFAVTRWLQGVALAIGLAGIGASFSAQVLARRREFGTLQHLGLTRRQVLAMVAAEGALWSVVGAVLGLLLGLAVSVVLVKVVNPQSFHWTMQMSLPLPTLLGLAVGVVAAGALTAWGSGHAAASRDVVRAVKEDW